MNDKFFKGTQPKKIDENKIEEMTIDIKNILDSSFMKTTKDFNAYDCIKLINNYIKEHDRLLYSVISNYIFELKNQDPGIFITNLDFLTQFVLSNKYNEEYLGNNKSNSQLEEYLKVKKTILKLWDHVHLALYQFDNLKQSDEEFKRKFIKNIEPVNTEVNKQLNEFTKGMNSQLISLVGIFTAMSFLVFGAINSLDDIFKNAQSIPILQIMIIGSIWGLCITNLVFIFMFFVSKMTKLEIKSCYRKDATLVEKYPLVFWSELVIIFILTSCSWLYYIDSQNIGKWFVNLGEKWPIFISVGGFVLIGVIFGFCVKKLNEKHNQCIEKQNTSQNNISEYRQKIKNKTIDKDEAASTL